MGGIGKSFLGLKIFTEFQKSKYRDCRVELQLETKQGDLCDIQKQILEKVCKHATSRFSNLIDGRQNMEKDLRQINDPIFLYVDNVLEPEYLTDLLPEASCFPNGSRILITSRGDHIGRGIFDVGITHYKLIEVSKLQKQQAQQLLWQQLKSKGEHRDISSSEVESEVESLEERVLELCDGLPLALTVVGKYIAYDNGLKKVEVWRQVVDDMEKAEPFGGAENDKLYSCIMFSMQNLNSNVKRAFLDVIVLVDCWKYRTISWENMERLVSNKYLKVLCERALVGKREKGGPEIHDVIKAIGKRMIKEDEKELRIIGMEEFEKHKNKNTLEKVVALGKVTVDAADMLKKMPLLRLLNDVYIVPGECQEIELRELRVVSALRCSTTRVFDLSQCPYLKEVTWGDSKDDHAPNVSNLQEVFKHDKISMGFEALALYGWSQLKEVGVIETLSCSLKELRLCNCKEIESLPEGISRLTALNQLVLSRCGNLKGLPQGISRLTGLEVLDFSFCDSVQSLPDGLTSLTGLAKLNLDDCRSLQNIPEGIGNLRRVTDFILNGCTSLESIPEGCTSLLMSGSSHELSLYNLSRIKHLPEGVTRLTGLKKLKLSGCGSLRSLPEGVSDLTGLTSLSLVLCKRLQALPEGIASLIGLIELDLGFCMALQSLPKELSCLTGLTSVNLHGCSSLQALPEKLGFMTHLSQLDLSFCESLQFLPDEISKLTGLLHLDLSDCKSLQSIQGVTTLTALRYIGLLGCRSLKSIPEGLGHFPGLHRPPANEGIAVIARRSVVDVKCLNLSDCESLESLPQSIGSFTLLEELDLTNCTRLESLPEGVTRLSNLAKLSLLGCRSLQCLPRGLIGSLTGLTELKLGECAMLIQPLVEEVSCNMTSLKVLELSKFEDLQSLPQGITTNLMSLEELSLSGCRNFQLLPQGMANWKGLARLDLSGCQSLQCLPEELTTLTALSDLNLSKCACLQSLPQGLFTSLVGLEDLSMSACGGLRPEDSQGITMLTGLIRLDLSESEHLLFPLSEQGLAANSLTGSLEWLNLSGCRSLQSLPEGVAALTNLANLDLGGCGGLDLQEPSVWETILSIKCLEYLNLSGWETMQALPEGIGSLESLMELDLSKCSSLLSLPESVTNLRDLEMLRLAECKSLQSLRPEITRLVELHELDLSGCTSLDHPLPEEITIWISGIKDYRPSLLHDYQ